MVKAENTINLNLLFTLLQQKILGGFWFLALFLEYLHFSFPSQHHFIVHKCLLKIALHCIIRQNAVTYGGLQVCITLVLNYNYICNVLLICTLKTVKLGLLFLFSFFLSFFEDICLHVLLIPHLIVQHMDVIIMCFFFLLVLSFS